MKLIKWISVIALLALVTSAFTLTSAAQPGPYRAIVVFDKGASQPTKDALVKSAGGTKIKNLGLINGQAAYLPSKSAAAALAKKPGVRRVDEDKIVTAGASKGSSVNQPAQLLPWGVDRIDAELVWPAPTSATGAGVKVAVIDTGIQLNHPDLRANIKGGYNAINPAKTANDDNGHGTHVAGTIAASANTIGVVGVGPNIDLYAVKVLGASGSGWLSDVVEGIQWAVNNNIKVVNMSFGSSAANASEQAAIISAYNAGITLVAAAGNSSGGAVGYPAAYDEVIAVSATTVQDNIAGFSSEGPQVDLAAPGSQIFSTYKGSKYMTLNGTSMASPHVAGAAALVIGAKGPLTPTQVKARLQATADLLSGPPPDQQGSGLVDAQEAVTTTTVFP